MPLTSSQPSTPKRSGAIALLGAAALAWAGFCAHYLTSTRMTALEDRMEQHLRDTQEALAQLRLRLDALGKPADTSEVASQLSEALDDLEKRMEKRMKQEIDRIQQQ